MRAGLQKIRDPELEAHQPAPEVPRTRCSASLCLCASARPACLGGGTVPCAQSPVPLTCPPRTQSNPSQPRTATRRAQALQCAHCLSAFLPTVAERLAEKLRLEAAEGSEQELVEK